MIALPPDPMGRFSTQWSPNTANTNEDSLLESPFLDNGIMSEDMRPSHQPPCSQLPIYHHVPNQLFDAGLFPDHTSLSLDIEFKTDTKLTQVRRIAKSMNYLASNGSMAHDLERHGLHGFAQYGRTLIINGDSPLTAGACPGPNESQSLLEKKELLRSFIQSVEGNDPSRYPQMNRRAREYEHYITPAIEDATLTVPSPVIHTHPDFDTEKAADKKSQIVIQWLYPPGKSRSIEVAGTFTNPPWSTKITLNLCPISSIHWLDLLEVDPNLKGACQYKFIVDGVWQCDPFAPICDDGSDFHHLNNFISVMREPIRIHVAERNARRLSAMSQRDNLNKVGNEVELHRQNLSSRYSVTSAKSNGIHHSAGMFTGGTLDRKLRQTIKTLRNYMYISDGPEIPDVPWHVSQAANEPKSEPQTASTRCSDDVQSQPELPAFPSLLQGGEEEMEPCSPDAWGAGEPPLVACGECGSILVHGIGSACGECHVMSFSSSELDLSSLIERRSSQEIMQNQKMASCLRRHLTGSKSVGCFPVIMDPVMIKALQAPQDTKPGRLYRKDSTRSLPDHDAGTFSFGGAFSFDFDHSRPMERRFDPPKQSWSAGSPSDPLEEESIDLLEALEAELSPRTNYNTECQFSDSERGSDDDEDVVPFPHLFLNPSPQFKLQRTRKVALDECSGIQGLYPLGSSTFPDASDSRRSLRTPTSTSSLVPWGEENLFPAFDSTMQMMSVGAVPRSSTTEFGLRQKWPPRVLELMHGHDLFLELENIIPKTAIRADSHLSLEWGTCVIPGGGKKSCADAVFGSSVRGGAMGVADGVGEWENFGIDPQCFSLELIHQCKTIMETSAPGDEVEPYIRRVMQEAYHATKNTGSSTCVIASFDAARENLAVASLGDSSCMILRRSGPLNKYQMVYRSTEQQHCWNMPYQLTRLPQPEDYPRLVEAGNGRLVDILTKNDHCIQMDLPEHCDVCVTRVREGDLVILGSDGVFDNLFTEELLSISNVCVSPVEAMALHNEDLATSAQAIATTIAEAAEYRSHDLTAKSPFAQAARAAHASSSLPPHVGGKRDDIACVAAWVTGTPREE